MRRYIFLVLLWLFPLLLVAQRNTWIKHFKQQVFSPEYAWQSKFLFDYDVHFYGLDLNVSPDTTFLSGHVSMGASLLVDKLDTLAVELIPAMKVDSAFLDGKRLGNPVRQQDNVLFTGLALTGKGTLFNVKIYYHGASPTGGFFSGVSTAYNKIWKKRVTWTLSEPFAAKSWFPVKEDLQDKADSAWIFLTVDSAYMAGSEGVLTRVVNLGNGKKRFEWKTHYPIDYYLLSFAVADYRDFSFYCHPQPDKNDSLLVQNFIYNSDTYFDQNRKDIERTGQFIALYSRLFGVYPFEREKYGHCLTELHGGMEHQTMTTLGSFGFDLVAHELGHMWFGDNVTCADWSDIWVNEGFASYADYLANEYINGDSIATAFMVKMQKTAMSQPGGSVYVPQDEVYQGNEWRIFNGRLTYDKGAAIIHMLRHEIGNDTLFFRILKTYQKKFAGSVATGDDFQSVVNSVTGRDYTWFFKQWYYGEGYPLFNVDWYRNNDTVFLLSTETTSTQNPAFFRVLQDYRFEFDDGSDTLVQRTQTAISQRFKIILGQGKKKIVRLQVDPFHWNLQKINKVDFVGVKTVDNPVAFILCPVPARRFLYLERFHASPLPVKIQVFDVQGRKVYVSEMAGTKLKLDVSGWKHGIYVVHVSGNGFVFVRKFIH